jgi:hypothetical protein
MSAESAIRAAERAVIPAHASTTNITALIARTIQQQGQRVRHEPGHSLHDQEHDDQRECDDESALMASPRAHSAVIVAHSRWPSSRCR